MYHIFNYTAWLNQINFVFVILKAIASASKVFYALLNLELEKYMNTLAP